MVMHPPLLYMGYVDSPWPSRSPSRRCWKAGSTAPGRAGRAPDHGRVVLPHHRHRPRKLVAYYELGWAAGGLDPVENALLHAVARRHRPHPLARRHREARRLQELDGAARHPRLFALAPGHLPRALGRAHQRARVRDGPETGGGVHPDLPRDRGRRLVRALRLARAEGGHRGQFAAISRESLLLSNNGAPHHRDGGRATGARSTRWC